MISEAEVTINGQRLSEGQVMALRVAASIYWENMQDENALGDDEHGRRMVLAYRDRLAEILRLMIEGKR